MTEKKEARTFFGYPEDDVQYQMLLDLGDLAVEWRRTKDPTFVDKYHQQLRALMDLGWDDYLDVDMELPDEFMPDFYLNKDMHKHLLDDLYDLAYKWRGSYDQQLVHEYHQKLKALMDSGWEGSLDFESELSDKFMPDFYLNKFLKPPDQS